MATHPLVALAVPDPHNNPPGTDTPTPSTDTPPNPPRQLTPIQRQSTPQPNPQDEPKRKPLTADQEAFVAAYLGAAKYDAKRAALIANPNDADPTYAKQRAWSYLQSESVRHAIRERAAQLTLMPEILTLSIADLATFDPSNLGDALYRYDEATGRRVVNWEAVQSAGLGPYIREVACSGKQAHETIRWYSKMDAMTLLARIMGLTRDRLDIGIVDVRKASDEELARLAES